MDNLEPFIGEWRMEAVSPHFQTAGQEDARTVFEWLPGRQFLIQRFGAPDPAPSGIAVIGFDSGRETLLQHYFDSRGIARIYEMTFADGIWTLTRTRPDFSPLDFCQRYSGRFSDDHQAIRGSWEIAHDGSTWEHDFELNYARLKS